MAYYVDQSKGSNHSVREAACGCIGELAAKVDPDAVRPHVARMLRTLLYCFKDASWPVSTCVTCTSSAVLPA